MSRVEERSLAPDLSLVDVQADLLWHRRGAVTLIYRLEPLHEPSLGDEDFNRVARAADDAWSSLPEGTQYQFLVLVDQLRGARAVADSLPPIPVVNEASQVLEEFRRARVAELTRVDPAPGGGMVQERRHFLACTVRPKALQKSIVRTWRQRAEGWLGRVASGSGRYERAFESVLEEAASFQRAIEVRLAQLGLGLERCRDGELVGLIHELLSPTSSRAVETRTISDRVRLDRHELPSGAIQELPWLADSSPIWTLIDDDLTIRREFLRLGEDYVTVLSLKSLPDRTEPGVLTPLLHLSRRRYQVSFSVDIPHAVAEIAALRAKATLADGLKLQNFLVNSDRKDAQAVAVARETDEAMERIIASTQRVLGISLQVVLFERSREDLEEAVQEVLGVLSRLHGLRGVRETYRLKEAWFSVLPGSPGMEERRRRALTPVVTDLLPIYSFRPGQGKVPFATPTSSFVLYDPFDTRAVPNANILVTGTSGAGKSFLVSSLISGYDVAAAAKGEPGPYVFILDNGASYRRYAELRPDGRYVLFTFDAPPGVDPFAWTHQDGSLDEHVSRLEWLLLDLLRVSEADEERFERVKAILEEALYALYRGDGQTSFAGLEAALRAFSGPEADALVQNLYPYVRGKFRRLFLPNPTSAMTEDIHVVCYDFHGLGEHRDLAAVALRLTIYEVRRWAARVSRQDHPTLLVLDESWALLEGGDSAVAGAAAPFIAASVRMGRKERMSVIGLSQVIEDFVQSAYGAAIIGNSATKFVGQPGGEGVEGLRRHLRLTDRQVEQVLALKRSPRWHEFLMIQGETTHVIRVPGDAFSRWVFTTSPRDKDRIATLESRRPDLDLLQRIRFLAEHDR